MAKKEREARPEPTQSSRAVVDQNAFRRANRIVYAGVDNPENAAAVKDAAGGAKLSKFASFSNEKETLVVGIFAHIFASAKAWAAARNMENPDYQRAILGNVRQGGKYRGNKDAQDAVRDLIITKLGDARPTDSPIVINLRMDPTDYRAQPTYDTLYYAWELFDNDEERHIGDEWAAKKIYLRFLSGDGPTQLIELYPPEEQTPAPTMQNDQTIDGNATTQGTTFVDPPPAHVDFNAEEAFGDQGLPN